MSNVGMRRSPSSVVQRWVVLLVLLPASGVILRGQEPTGTATWFVGATLITGEDTPPITDSAFLVQEGAFAWVGRRDDREPPPGTLVIDLGGTTVIPALIDAHQHIGLTRVRTGTSSPDHYTRANLVDHLQRSAYHGVAATMSLGLEADEDLAFRLRDERLPHAARFLTRVGASPLPRWPVPSNRIGGAFHEARALEAEGRAVSARAGRPRSPPRQDLGRRPGRFVVPKLGADVVAAIIDEAHQRGMHVTAHVGTTSALQDARTCFGLESTASRTPCGIGTLTTSTWSLVRERPHVWDDSQSARVTGRLRGPARLSETLPPFEIENLRQQAARPGGRRARRALRAPVPESRAKPRSRHDHRHGH